MAKNNKKPKNDLPAIYVGLDTTKAGTDKCIVLDRHNQFFKFDNGSVVTIVKEGILYEWESWELFHSWCEKNVSQFVTVHNLVFKENPRGGSDVLMVSLYVWKKMLLICADRTTEGNPINQPDENGKTPGKRKNETRKYFMGPESANTAKISLIKTPQARACFFMLRDSINQRVAAGQPAEITEEDFRKVVQTRAPELKTRQDPWRIFQYYRPVLLTDHLIKHD